MSQPLCREKTEVWELALPCFGARLSKAESVNLVRVTEEPRQWLYASRPSGLCSLPVCPFGNNLA